MDNGDIIKIAIEGFIHIAGAVATLAIGAAFSTYRRSISNSKDLDHAFKKIRALEEKNDGSKRN